MLKEGYKFTEDTLENINFVSSVSMEENLLL